MRVRRWLVLGLTCLFTIFSVTILTPPAWVQPSPPNLFTAIRGEPPRSTSPTVKRQRLVQVNANLLKPTRTRGGQALSLNLFDDANYTVNLEQVERSLDRELVQLSPQTRSAPELTQSQSAEPVLVQFGTVRGISDSEVLLASRGAQLSGSVRLPDGKLYEIVPSRSNSHVIRELNPAAFPPQEPPEVFDRLSRPRSTTRGTSSNAQRLRLQQARLKVMVLFTPQVLETVGGIDVMQLLISRVEAQMNRANRLSGVKLTVHVSQLGVADYTETGSAETDLNNFSKAALDQKLRQRYKVGAVSLWVTRMEDACGIGDLNRTAADFKNAAFSVVSVDCVGSNLTFPHELGHNLGSCHDYETSPNCVGAFPYSYGYRDPRGAFRTIMAYDCNVGKGCPVLPVWSNPKLLLNQRQRLGIAGKADNARSLNGVT